jgi:hypothetical protein
MKIERKSSSTISIVGDEGPPARQPRLDFQEDDNIFHRTRVAQISTFVLGALASEAPSQSWHDAAATLDTWAVEYIDILKIPETERKARRDSYKARRWKGFFRSPIRTRSRRLAATCDNPADGQVHDSDDEEDDNDTPFTPTPNRTARQRVSQRKPAATRRGGRGGTNKNNANDQDEIEAMSTSRIEDRPYRICQGTVKSG